MSADFLISRSDLAQVFGSNPRVLQQFEELQRRVSEHDDTIGANVAATTAQADASYVTLSPNAELNNEFVLQVGPGLSLDAEAGVVKLTLQAPVVTGGFSVQMTAQGDSALVLPLTGVLATQQWVFTLAPGPYADDAAATTAGIAVGECYRKGSGSSFVLATRMA